MRNLRLLIAATFALPALLTLSACAAVEPADDDPILMGHIHDLAFDTAGDLLIGSHAGVYLVDVTTHAVELVGDTGFDAMGLTVSGDVVLASGHPGPESGDTFTAPNIGLVRYTAATGWESVSLAGATDFHALATTPANPNLMVGLSTSRAVLDVTIDNGHSWQAGGNLDARDVILDVNNPDLVVATTPDGVVTSTDGGMSFTALPGAPYLTVIASDHTTAGGVLGIDTDGKIWAGTTTPGQTWALVDTTTGTASAIAQDPRTGAVAVADERGIRITTDGGDTWQVIVPV